MMQLRMMLVITLINVCCVYRCSRVFVEVVEVLLFDVRDFQCFERR